MDCILSISIISLHKKLSSAWENVSQPTNWFEAIEAHANPYVPYVPYVPHIHLNKFITHLKSKYHKNKLITKKRKLRARSRPFEIAFFLSSSSSFLPSFLSIYLPIAITTIYEQRMTNPPPSLPFCFVLFYFAFFLFLPLISESSEVLALVLSY